MTRFLDRLGCVLFSASVAACSASHGTPHLDASSVGLDAGASRDAGAAPDSASDAGHVVGPHECTFVGDVALPFGSPCFCLGALASRGDIVYRAGYALDIFDARGPMPLLVGQVAPSVADLPELIAVSGEALITAGRSITVFDLADPIHPVVASRLELSVARVLAMAAAGNHRVFIVVRSADGTVVRQYDVTDPHAPVVTSVTPLAAPNADLMIAASESQLFVLATSGTAADPLVLSVYSHSATAPPMLVGTLALTLGAGAAISYDAGMLIASGSDVGVLRIDLSDPAHPRAIAVHQPADRDVRRAFLRGRAAIVVSSAGVALVDVSGATGRVLDLTANEQDVHSVDWIGDVILLSNGNGLRFVRTACDGSP